MYYRQQENVTLKEWGIIPIDKKEMNDTTRKISSVLNDSTKRKHIIELEKNKDKSISQIISILLDKTMSIKTIDKWLNNYIVKQEVFDKRINRRLQFNGRIKKVLNHTRIKLDDIKANSSFMNFKRLDRLSDEEFEQYLYELHKAKLTPAIR